MKNVGKKIAPEHDGNHYPSGKDDETFQESWAFSWFDPVSKIGGWQHIGMQRPRKIADLNSYLSYRGDIVGRFIDLEMKMPEDDFTDLEIGPIKIKTKIPLTSHQITIDHGDYSVDLTMNAFVGPYGMGHKDADSHWESFGRVEGVANISGNKIPVSGLAFQDRSWGGRDMTGLLAYRLMTAIFDENLIFRLFQMTRKDGHSDYGFVYDSGTFHEISGIESDIRMGGDGTTLKDATINVWTKSGRGYQLQGWCADNDLVVQRDNLIGSHSNTVYHCGGRLGAGFIDVQGLRAPAPFHKLR